ncbi:TPA: hypothetical protein DCX16_04475 [bacterium]|nr:hypothetical protein [bacterium]
MGNYGLSLTIFGIIFNVKKGWFVKWLSKYEVIDQEPFRKIDCLFGFFVFFIAFSVYLHTLTPTIGFHDSGELITVAWTLGIAHPPGYPFYTIFGKLWTTLIPIGNVAFRMNMQSALFASLAAMMVYFITLKLTRKIIPSIVASLILAFSLTFWEQAIIAEKYTLNAFFATLIIFILLKWQEIMSQKLLLVFSFILSLSFTHHFQTIYLVPGSILFILAISWKNRKMFNRRIPRPILQKIKFLILRFATLPLRMNLSLSFILKMVLVFVIPLSLWLYLPLRANQDPIFNWGDPRNLDNFIIHILVKSYTGYFLSIKESLIRLSSHLGFFTLQFNKYILWIPIIGIPFFLKRKILLFFFLLIFIVNVLHSIRFTIVNIYDYYIPSFIIMSIIIGIGLSFIVRFLPFLSFFILLLVLFPYLSNHFQNTRTKFFFSYDYGMNILRPLKKEAIAFSYGDYDAFPLWYLQHVEERRKDIASLTWMFLPCDWHIGSAKRLHPNISFPFSSIAYKDLKYHNIGGVIQERLNKIITSNFDMYPIYAGHGIRQEKGIADNFSLIPDGLFFKLLPKDEKRLTEELEKTKIVFLFQGKGFKDRVASDVWKNYALIYNEVGNLYRQKDVDRAIAEYKKALSIDSSCLASRLNLAFAYIDKKNYNEAKNELEKIIKEDKNFNPTLVHYGLGLVYQKEGNFREAIEEYNQALKSDPNNERARQCLEQCKILLDKE